MKKYSYIALTPKNQKRTGIIAAKRESEARKKLHAMRFSVISLEEGAKEGLLDGEEIKTFAFFVRDNSGNPAEGTIDAPNRKKALQRLISEYHFQVDALCDTSAYPENEWQEKGKNGLFQLYDEIRVKNEKQEENSEEIIEENFPEKIEEETQNAQTFLEEKKRELEPEEYYLLRKKIDELKRIRSLGNNEYIQDLLSDFHLEKKKIEERILKKKQNEEKNFYSKKLETPEEENFERKKMDSSFEQNLTQKNINKNFYTDKIPASHNKKSLQEKFQSFFLFRNKKNETQEECRSSLSEDNQSTDNSLSKLKERIPQKQEEIFSEMFVAQTPFAKFLREARLLFGWLLTSYIVYLYASILILTKFSTVNAEKIRSSEYFPPALLEFLDRSLSSPFPFLGTAIFFCLFFGFTLCIRFAQERIWLASIFLFLTTVSIGGVVYGF